MEACVYLGNMTVEQIESEDWGYNFSFTDEERARLKETHHPHAHFEKGESGWHMFDIPRFLCISPDDIGREALEIFQRHSSEMNGQFPGGYAY